MYAYRRWNNNHFLYFKGKIVLYYIIRLFFFVQLECFGLLCRLLDSLCACKSIVGLNDLEVFRGRFFFFKPQKEIMLMAVISLLV